MTSMTMSSVRSAFFSVGAYLLTDCVISCEMEHHRICLYDDCFLSNGCFGFRENMRRNIV